LYSASIFLHPIRNDVNINVTDAWHIEVLSSHNWLNTERPLLGNLASVVVWVRWVSKVEVTRKCVRPRSWRSRVFLNHSDLAFFVLKLGLAEMRFSDALVQIVELFENNAIPRARAEVCEFLTLFAIVLVELALMLSDLSLGERNLAVIYRLFPGLSRTSSGFYLFQLKCVWQRVVSWTRLVRVNASFSDHRSAKHLL
jgi:hypothetical protein